LRVRADPDHLHRILVNLLRNAREAVETSGRPTGRVQASVTRVSGVTTLRLSDDGPGLPERVQRRLFQPFAGSGRTEGAGLGLAISRELAQLNGGELALAETGPGGTTFELRLPAG
jgi:signal transduction histidine kinase